MTRSMRKTLTITVSLATLGLVAPTVATAGESFEDPKQQRTQGEAEVPKAAQDAPQGIDVASHQENVDWKAQWDAGKRFAYVKATEGTSYVNPFFTQQYNGSYDVGMIRGAYHFGRPDGASGAEQADYFIANGGGWSKDGKTLPGVLDIEFSPVEGQNQCYDKSPEELVTWIRDFVNRYKEKTGRDAVIYTNAYWWQDCTGNSAEFGENPLWLANYGEAPDPLPAGWNTHTIWQYSETPIDQNVFNGDMSRLEAFANGE